MRSSTETIARALRILAAQINAPDDVPRLALQEAAERLEELEAKATAAPAALPLGFLSDVLTAAGLVEHGRQCKDLADRLGSAVLEIRSSGKPEPQHDRVAKLETEVERLREQAELYQQAIRACSELPEGYYIRIELERDSGCVELCDVEGDDLELTGGQGSLALDLCEAIDAALARKEAKS